MARDGYGIQIKGLDELIKGMAGSSKDLKNLTRLSRDVAQMAGQDVRRRVPVYHGTRRGTPRGILRAEVESGGNRRGAWVQMHDRIGILILQEFGGTSFWHRSGRGAIRSSFHEGAAAAAARAGVKGHVIYKKPHKKYGYFIWNVAYRLRYRLSKKYMQGIADIIKRNGIAVDLGTSADLFTEQTPGELHR